MAEDAGKSLSARGAFVIGLALGAGILLIYSILQTKRLTGEIQKLRNDLTIMETKVANSNAELAKLRDATIGLRPVVAPAPAPAPAE
jgi:hypothetical protein